MANYKPKNIQIEAVQYDGSAESIMDIIDFFGNATLTNEGLFLKTAATGKVKIEEGTYIYKLPDGSFNLMAANNFESFFEVVNDVKIEKCGCKIL